MRVLIPDLRVASLVSDATEVEILPLGSDPLEITTLVDVGLVRQHQPLVRDAELGGLHVCNVVSDFVSARKSRFAKMRFLTCV